MPYLRHRRLATGPSKAELRAEAATAVAAWRPAEPPSVNAGEALIDMREEWLAGLRAWAEANGNVRELWLFGSRATERSRPDSDVDLALVLMPPTGNHHWAMGNYVAKSGQWRAELEAIVGRLVSLEAVTPEAEEVAVLRRVHLWARA